MTRVWALAVSVFLLASAPANAQAPELSAEASERVLRLLEGTGYRYSKLSATQWLVPFDGEHRKRVEVRVIATNSVVSLVAVVAAKTEARNAAEAMGTLLKLSNRVDELRFLLDSEDNFSAGASFALQSLTIDTFKAHVLNVASVADYAYRDIKVYMASAAPEPPRVVSLPPRASRALELLNGKASIAFDPTRWTETGATPEGYRQFRHSRGESYAVIVAERVEIPTERLRDIGLENMKAGGGIIENSKEERRRVNGVDVIMMQLDVNAKGVPLTYVIYYHGGPAGSLQIVTFTARNLIQEYRSELEEFLNGLTVRP